jgi:hypothetical protein
MEAIAAVGYPQGFLKSTSLAAARYEDGGLQVGTHRQYAACVAACATSECVIVQLGEQETTVMMGTTEDKTEVSLAAHLRAQCSAHEALEQMLAARHDTTHDPFADPAARVVMESLAPHAEQDSALSQVMTAVQQQTLPTVA